MLPVIPNQMEAAGYSKIASIEATALSCAIGCVLAAFMTNLPFVIAPPTAVSIYLAVFLQRSDMNQAQGDTIVILSGIALLFIGIVKPLTTIVTKMIPDCIQSSTAVGIGLITALAGAIELELVMPGKYTILEMGPITPAIIIATISVIIIAVATHYKYRGAFVSGMVFGTLTWWWWDSSWPEEIFAAPHFALEDVGKHSEHRVVSGLSNLVFLYILTVNGIAKSLSDLGGLSNTDGSIPRGNWLLMVCGITTILSGCFSGPPILISPETAVGIKAGAKTGLSTLVCGAFFFVSIFFCPLFKCVPPAGTSPLLILVGMLLFMNVNRIKWGVTIEAIPAFFVLLLIPFTYSILQGVGFGYLLFVCIGVCTGELYTRMQEGLRKVPVIVSSTSDSDLVGSGGSTGVVGGPAGDGNGRPPKKDSKTSHIDVASSHSHDSDPGMLMYSAHVSPSNEVLVQGLSGHSVVGGAINSSPGRNRFAEGAGKSTGEGSADREKQGLKRALSSGLMIAESFASASVSSSSANAMKAAMQQKSGLLENANFAVELAKKSDDNSRYNQIVPPSSWDMETGINSMNTYI